MKSLSNATISIEHESTSNDKISIINALALLMYGNVYGELTPVSNRETLPPNLSKESAITRNKELDDYKTLHSLVANKNTPITWVLAGDSITQGNFHTRGARCYPELNTRSVSSSRDVMIFSFESDSRIGPNSFTVATVRANVITATSAASFVRGSARMSLTNR